MKRDCRYTNRARLFSGPEANKIKAGSPRYYIPLPPGEDYGVYTPIDGLMKMMGTSREKAQKMLDQGNLKQGCLGLYNLIATDSNAPFQHAFKTAEEANAYMSTVTGPVVTGVLQMKAPPSIPTLPNGEVNVQGLLAFAGGDYTFAVKQPDGSFITMNIGVGVTASKCDPEIHTNREQWGKKGETTFFLVNVSRPPKKKD